MECLNSLTASLQQRDEIECESKKKFEELESMFTQIKKEALVDYNTRTMEERAQHNRVFQQWLAMKKDLYSEIGVWKKKLVSL